MPQKSTSDLEKLSSMVSLSVLEFDFYQHDIISAYLIANLMSPSLWKWREEKSAYDSENTLLSTKGRLRKLQRFFHGYQFTRYPEFPGEDPWGLFRFRDDERRFGSAYVKKRKLIFQQSLSKLLEEKPDSQFGGIIKQDYYHEGCFPRLRNEIIDIMNAYSLHDESIAGSGKCIALGMLWAASLILWGRFSPEKVSVIGNHAHIFIFLDEEEGHLLNNTRWFSKVRIHNQSSVSEFVKMITADYETTFVYNPVLGICECTAGKSEIPDQKLNKVYASINSFLHKEVKHTELDQINYLTPQLAFPDPLEYDSAEAYQQKILSLAQEFPDSIYEYALYAFRTLSVARPEVYIHAAKRDYHVKNYAQDVYCIEDAVGVAKEIPGNTSVFHDRTRIALPDETIFFQTGSDLDKALLIYILLDLSPHVTYSLSIGFTPDSSFVFCDDKVVHVNRMKVMDVLPYNANLFKFG